MWNNSDPFVPCPYNILHQVPRSRLQIHIVKCQKHNPKLESCPYNATHRFPRSELKKHILMCPTRASILSENIQPKVTGDLTIPVPINQREFLPDPNHEMWDD